MVLMLAGASLAVFAVVCVVLLGRKRRRAGHPDVFRAIAAELDPELAAVYRARASDGAAAGPVLRDPRIRVLLLRSAQADGRFSVSALGGQGTVAYEDVDAPLSLERLRDLHALVASSLDRLAAAGVARP